MRLNKLRITSYRNHADTELDLSGASLVVVRGANASGKSSIGQSISVNLTNTTMGLDTAGKGFTSKIKTGDVKAVITADIQGKHLLRNIVTLQTNTSGRTSNVECIDSPDDSKIVNGFTNFLKDRKSAILIACNTDFYSRLEEKDQIALLAKLVLPAHYDFPVDKIEATNGFLDTPINFDAEPFEVITKAYKSLYKERETINRQVKDFDIPDALPIPKGVDSESLQTQLVGIREQRTKLQAERDAAVSAANAIEVKRGILQTKIEGLQADVKRNKEKLATVETRILVPGKLSEMSLLASRKEELKALQDQHVTIEAVLSATNQQIDRLDGISGQGATCPVCDQTIDVGSIEHLVADLKKEYADADARIQALDKQIEAIGDIGTALSSIQSHNEAVKEKSEIEKSLSETVETVKATRVELNALGEVINATLPFNDPFADLQAKEDNINEQIRPVIAAEERAKERERLTEQLAKLQKKAATLDSLVKYYDKDGIKKELIGTYVGGFESKVNFVLSAWGYKTSLTMEPFAFEVTTPRGYVGPVKELSGAEEHIFKAAFQCAVSIAAGIGFVVIDEVEEIGEEIRKNLYVTIFNLIQSKQLEQAILIGYSLDKTLPKPQAPGSRYFYVENGTVEELK
jgi:DNA repair exonuclease SbcCD ATPase subunit